MPWSDVMCDGAPCFAKTCWMNNSASADALIVLVVGTNTACFVSLSTTTRMSVKPSDRDSCSIKSIDIDSQGCGGTGSCFNNP